jgi:hypothetical protein
MTEEISKEVSEKINYLDKMLNKDVFNNPIREVQEGFRKELLQFKEIFEKNLNDLEATLVFNN